MTDTLQKQLQSLLLSLLPEDHSTVGNITLLTQLQAATLSADLKDIGEEDFKAARDALVADGQAVKGKGRGGSLARATGANRPDFALKPEEVTPDMLTATAKVATTKKPGKAKAAPQTSATGDAQVLAYRHADRRKNNPEVGLVNEASDPEQAKTPWSYDPHLDPALQFDSLRAGAEKLIEDALAGDDPAAMRHALEELRRMSAPYLQWTGKAERTSFEVDTVSLHVHERIDAMSILSAVSKRQGKKSDKAGSAGFQPGLFEAPFESMPLRAAVDFYKHDRGWANRLVAGDSLLVMNSLLQKEGMAGQVQMIYIDPPYGIKYGSNFQPFTNKRDVKDRSDADLTQEPEMIKAFRDTWELGIHSYLTYLRDRLLLAKDLLSETGSVFVQISDENLHHIRELLDEVFGATNFVQLVAYRTTGGQASALLPTVSDYLIWYAKNRGQIKYNQLFSDKTSDDEVGRYRWIEELDGRVRGLTKDEESNPKTIGEGRLLVHDNITSQGVSGDSSEPLIWNGKSYNVPANSHWKTTPVGMERLAKQHRLIAIGETLRFKRLLRQW